MAKFNNWKIVDSIKQGGQGQIHLVKDRNKPDSDRIYVLKQLINKKRLDRFKDEINTCIALEHSNIVHIVDFDLENKSPFMIMPYYEKGDLTNLNLDQLSINQKLSLFKGINKAAAFAHENNVVHRDLKPENIFLEDNLNPIVADFGLCFIDDEDGERFTLTEEAVGSRYYMAPEFAEGKIESVTKTSDVYSLGKILYWLFNGKIFDRERHRDERYDLTKENPKREYYLINEFLDKMIVEDPNDRLADAVMVLDELNILIRRIDTGANCIGPEIPQTCIYCGVGEYKQIRNSISIGQTVIGNIFKFVDDGEWLFFQCENCLNIQLFRAIMKGSINRWVKEDNK